MARFRPLLVLVVACSLQLPSIARAAGTASAPQVEPRPGEFPAQNPTTPAPVIPSSTVPKPAAQSPEQPPRRPSPPAFSVVIDPAHGGNDTGARISPNLLEKDLTLLLAKKLRQELQTRHIGATLLRDNDSNLTFDERAVAVNRARPSVFVTLHAEPGSTIRIYMPALNSISVPQRDKSAFLLWESAQSAYLSDSGILARTAETAIEKRELRAVVEPTLLEPLHSIAAPAIAVEVPASRKGFQVSADLIAGALADAIAIRKMSTGAPQ